MASDVLIQHLHLIQSVLGQKVEAKPRGSSPRERSQGRAARLGHEVACLPGRMGLPLGRSRERASPFRAKFVLSGHFQTGRVSAYATSGAPVTPVFQAITFCAWFVRFTDEVPRRPGLIRRVTASYKSHTKGLPHASVTGTGSPRPCLSPDISQSDAKIRSSVGGRSVFRKIPGDRVLNSCRRVRLTSKHARRALLGRCRLRSGHGTPNPPTLAEGDGE